MLANCAICDRPADRFVLGAGVRLCDRHACEVEAIPLDEEYGERKTPPPK